MTYETRELRGSVFTNNRREKPAHPDYTGEAKIDGKLYWVSCWQKTDKSGKPWFSFSFKEKDFQPAIQSAQNTQVQNTIDDDVIPF